MTPASSHVAHTHYILAALHWLEAINRSPTLWWLVAAMIFVVALNVLGAWLIERSAIVDSDLRELEQTMQRMHDSIKRGADND